MKFNKASALALLLQAASARFVLEEEQDNVVLYPNEVDQQTYLIELAPGVTRRVTEDEKWELRRNGENFFDITDTPDLGATRVGIQKKAVFPDECKHQDTIKPLLKDLDKHNIERRLTQFTSFHTRYYKSDYGRQSSAWLLSEINTIIEHAGADKHGIIAEPFKHDWPQSSIIVNIPGKSNNTVVIGAHQDSINLFLPSILAAPGADDDGSGSMTILEVLRVLLSIDHVVKGEAENTIEFHWYSAEEGGLLGSQAIFHQYEKDGREVKAMLQQDMTGFVQRTIDAGKPESVGVITDFVDSGLTDFIKKVITEYCSIPYVETKCGYACSDHASASKAGYPSAFVIESTFETSDNHIHSTDDLIKYLSFDHMLEHAKMTLGLVYELGSTDFKALEGKSESEQVVFEDL